MHVMGVAINWGPALLIVFGFLVTAVYQTHHFDKRIDDLKLYVDSLSKRLEDLIRSEVKRLEDLIKSEVKRLEDRLERLEHPIYRP